MLFHKVENPRGDPLPIGDGDGDVKQFPDGDGDARKGRRKDIK